MRDITKLGANKDRILIISPSPPVSSTNKTDRHDITEILVKVALITIKQIKSKQSKILQKSISCIHVHSNI
jgi:hypothetical protein